MTDLLEGADNTPVIPQDQGSYYERLVGENKKFKDQEALAKGKYEADEYVSTLEKQLDVYRNDLLKMRDEAATRANMEQILNQIESKQNQQHTNNLPPVNDVSAPKMDPKEIESLIDSRISATEMKRKEQENFSMVQNKLKEHFGDNYQAALKQQIDTLGISKERLNELATKEPQFLLRALGVGQVQRENFQAPPRGNVRSDNFAPTVPEKRTWSFYQKMRKENPNLYLDPKTNIQMHRDALALGEDFKDGDFGAYGDR